MTETSEIDQQFMRRAIRLAMNGRGRVEPNPMVGCVVVSGGGRVIGEGWHEVFGGPHAEPNALASCTESPAGATAYVTLEPCCHTNKKTPPCAPRLIEAGVGRVVIGALDPNPEVDGRGVAVLREAGIRVDGPVLEGEAKQLIAPFVARTRLGRPYVTLKWAQTADGRVAGKGGERMQISNSISRELVHELRSRSDGILVGVNTVLTDDPALNARFARVRRDPPRFILDRDLRTPVDAQVVTDRSVSTTLFCGHDTSGPFRRRRDALETAGATVTIVNKDSSGRLKLRDVLSRVFATSRTSDVLIEPGPTLAAGFFSEADLVDRLWVFRSPEVVNDPTAPAAAKVPEYFVESGRVDVDGDTLTEYLNPRSPVFFGNAPSADLVLAQS